MNRLMLALALAGFLGVFTLAASGCKEEGPLEKAGEAVDDAAEDAGEAIEEATEDLDDKK